MTPGSGNSKDFGEITLALALVGGIIAVLLKVIDYSNNQYLQFDTGSKPLVIFLIGFLLIELLIIFLFFVFKGISAYADDTRQEQLEHISKELFIFSFIIAFGWFIASVWILFLKFLGLADTLSVGGIIGYISIAIFTVVIILTIFYTEIKNLIGKLVIIEAISKLILSISKLKRYIITEIKNLIGKLVIIEAISKLILSISKLKRYIIIVLLIIVLLILLFDIFYIVVPQYLLTGSYSIEEFSPSFDNPDILTFTVKEKGISYDLIDVILVKLNSSEPTFPNDIRRDNIDRVIANRNIERENQTNSCYLSVTNLNSVWYLNIINISNLSSGTYLLYADVKNDLIDKSTIGGSKRIADKLFYIPPQTAKANYSLKCNRTS